MPTAGWIYERGLELGLQHLDTQARPSRSAPLPPRTPELPHVCPLCERRFASVEALGAHFQNDHKHESAYLIVNGQVTDDNAVATTGIQSIRLILRGPAGATVHVGCAGRPLMEVAAGVEDLLPVISASSGSVPDGRIVVEVRTHGRPLRSFTVHNGRPTEVRHGLIDPAMQEVMIALDAHGPAPDMDRVRREIDAAVRRQAPGHGLSAAEREYGDALLAYALGMWLEAQGRPDDAAIHISDAFGVLRGARTPLGVHAQHALALKLEAFAALRSCADTSEFAPARAFFADGAVSWSPGKSGSDDAHAIVFIDDRLKHLLDALRAYYASDDDGLAGSLTLLDFASRNDAGLRDRAAVHLIRARHHARRGQDRAATAEYCALLELDHPLYMAEADAHARSDAQ